ncbi:SRPBCC family protein [Nocardia otitidiscaviarum]|uniref:SRPBCC family protein n=1 Tax=Nocardia otitidiscaviarum TaxID=1823 RepID=UPI0004A6FED2|nr:SRPBCC family protein [Nocardia otitidiscaviarum]MBF6132685.1 SRPBCC family protein [Nocardia otitidiscaviarum]MBF6239061.1 SRPBCC family protein [Nocardia otitidiscaviarum]MBF6486104.1 SRPBCC family protein [Nocardia otitidiscaviarum]
MPLLTDPAAVAGLVARELRSGERAGAPTKIAVARRTYATEQADLWSALTDIERIPRWFAPVSGDLKLGGKYQIEGNAGGVVEECDEPRRFAITWVFNDQTSWVQVTLAPDGDGTRLELVHEAPVDPEFWERFGPGAVGVGWDLALMGLGEHLATGRPMDPALTQTFHETPEGRAFIEAAARGWAEAAIGDGEDPAAARAAADRTIAFYTGAPEDGAHS